MPLGAQHPLQLLGPQVCCWAARQAPPVQTCPLPQAPQIAPEVPQATLVLPTLHTVPAQQPEQLDGLQVGAGEEQAARATGRASQNNRGKRIETFLVGPPWGWPHSLEWRSVATSASAPVPVAHRVEGFSYAIRNVVREAKAVEAAGRRVRYLNVG